MLKKIIFNLIDFFFKPFYKYLFFFPFNLKIVKYPIYKQIQYLHFNITRKFRTHNEIVKVELNKNHCFNIEVIPGTDFHQMYLYMAGYYEKSISENILNNLKYADVFVDVGAYIGYYSLLASTSFPEIQIHAFEPQKEAYEKLKKNINNNLCNNIEVNNYALGHTNEVKQLNINKYPEQTSLFHQSVLQTSENYMVSVKRLDELLEINKKNVVIKIDTEGYEFEAMKGMSEIMNNNNCTIYFEYNPKIYQQQFGQDYSLSFFQFISEKGYKIFEIKANGKVEEFLLNLQQLEQQNLLARKNV